MSLRKVCLAVGLPSVLLAGLLWSKNFPNGVTLEPSIYPAQETEYLLKHHRGENVLNHWNFGSYLLFKARNELRIFVDGRAGTAYPPEVFHYLARDGFKWDKIEELVEKYNITVAVMPRYNKPCLSYFRNDSRWLSTFEGPAGVVFTRNKDLLPDQ